MLVTLTMNGWMEDILVEEASKVNEGRRRYINPIDSAMESAKGGADQEVDPEQALVLLRSLPLLRQLPEESLSRIVAVLKTVHYGPGEPIVQLNSEGERLYIIWKGEAKVVSPLKEDAIGHTVSTLRCGDYFGLGSPASARLQYKTDVFAINEVTCLLLTHDYADLISGASVWNWSGQSAEGELALVEQILDLEKVEANFFKSKFSTLKVGKNPNIFGGQSIGQALLAASRTVDPGFTIHSFHSYFIRTGKDYDPVVYRVERTRDGMSFATRHVEAIQFGKVIFVMYASFKRPDDTSAFEHNNHPMPSVPDPEEITSEELLYDNFLMDPRLPLSVKQKYAGANLPLSPIEVRRCAPSDRFQRVKRDSRNNVWMRTRNKLSEDPIMHRCAGGFASDILLLETTLLSHPEHVRSRLQVLSLDHSMWFHRPFKADEWFLCEMEGPWTGDGRGLSTGRIYQDEELVISISQEGIMRRIGEKMEKVAKL